MCLYNYLYVQYGEYGYVFSMYSVGNMYMYLATLLTWETMTKYNNKKKKKSINVFMHRYDVWMGNSAQTSLLQAGKSIF